MFNGSAGPLLRPATALDWAGDPFDASQFQAGARRAQLRGDARALRGLHRHRRRQPAEPAVHDARAQCLSADRREATGATGCCRTSTPGWNARPPTAASCRARSGSTAASAGQQRQVVRRRLRLGVQPHRAADRQARGPQSRAALHRRIHERRAAHRRRPLHARVAPAERGHQSQRAAKSTASYRRRACAAPRAGTATRRVRIE